MSLKKKNGELEGRVKEQEEAKRKKEEENEGLKKELKEKGLFFVFYLCLFSMGRTSVLTFLFFTLILLFIYLFFCRRSNEKNGARAECEVGEHLPSQGRSCPTRGLLS